MKKLLGMAGKKQMILPQIPETLIRLIKLTLVILTYNFFFLFSVSLLVLVDSDYWQLTLSLLPFLLCMFFPWSFLHLFLYFEKFHSLFLCPDSDCYLAWLATHIIALSCCTLICLHLEVLPCVPTSDSILYTWLCLLFHSVCYTASHHLWLA